MRAQGGAQGPLRSSWPQPPPAPCEHCVSSCRCALALRVWVRVRVRLTPALRTQETNRQHPSDLQHVTDWVSINYRPPPPPHTHTPSLSPQRQAVRRCAQHRSQSRAAAVSGRARATRSRHRRNMRAASALLRLRSFLSWPSPSAPPPPSHTHTHPKGRLCAVPVQMRAARCVSCAQTRCNMRAASAHLRRCGLP
jgi:hypothetical protein